MSWLSENYEKAALGGAAVIALAVGASILGAASEEAPMASNPNTAAAFEVAELTALAELSDKVSQKASWVKVDHLGQPLTMFVGAPVYSIKGDPTVKEIEPDTKFDGIPLSWWNKYGLEDYKYENPGSRDADKEGFTNREEFDAGTNPADAKSHPDFIKKLKLVNSKALRFKISWSVYSADKGNFTLKLGGRKYRNLPSSSDACKVGESFPKEYRKKSFINRFKVTKRGDEVNPATGKAEAFFDILDTRKNITTRLWYSKRDNQFADWSMTFKLDTPDGGPEFTVAEGDEFSIPFVKGKKGYKLLLKKRDSKIKKLENVEIGFKNASKQETMTLEYVAPNL